MSGSMTDLEDTITLDERHHAEDPISPSAQGDSGRHEIVGEGELVIKQTEEKSEDDFHVYG